VIEAWRIVKAEYADDAFSGEGARLYAGRWHSEGTRIVYTAESIALATLEILVRMRRMHVPEYRVIPCYFPEALVEELDVAFLPKDWSSAIAPTTLRRFGDVWARERVSAVLKVPSAVTLVEFNYLLNPEHPDFASIDIGEPRPFSLDLRLIT
jgi:RES domain-containing protein